MELEHIKVNYYEVDYYDLEQFIEKHYGVSYSIEAEEEAGNDETLTYKVEDTEPYSWDKQAIEDFRNGKSKSCRLHLILEDLCKRDLIEPGHYLINISY